MSKPLGNSETAGQLKNDLLATIKDKVGAPTAQLDDHSTVQHVALKEANPPAMHPEMVALEGINQATSDHEEVVLQKIHPTSPGYDDVAFKDVDQPTINHKDVEAVTIDNMIHGEEQTDKDKTVKDNAAGHDSALNTNNADVDHEQPAVADPEPTIDDPNAKVKDSSNDDATNKDTTKIEWPERVDSDDEDAKKPCSACTMTRLRQSRSRYKSNVSVIYECSDRGVWTIGQKYVLKERGKNGGHQEVLAAKFLRENTTIPVPEIVDHWFERDRELILMKRVPGETIEKAWPKLTDEEKHRIAQQTAGCLAQLRKFTSPCMEGFNGDPLDSGWLFGSDPPTGPMHSDDEFWAVLEKQMDSLPESSRKNFRKLMPPCEPYTLSHSDLFNCNIMVHNGNLSAIIDWEICGYFPVWWEHAFLQTAFSREDYEWRKLLGKYLPKNSQAGMFYTALHDIARIYRDPESVHVKTLENWLADPDCSPSFDVGDETDSEDGPDSGIEVCGGNDAGSENDETEETHETTMTAVEIEDASSLVHDGAD